MSQKIVFVSWFMTAYGVAFMGNCASFLTLDDKETTKKQYDLQQRWEQIHKTTEIHCFFPELYKTTGNEKFLKTTNHTRKEKYEALKKEYPNFDSEEFWEVCHIMEFGDQLLWFEKMWGKSFTCIHIDEIRSDTDQYEININLTVIRRYVENTIVHSPEKMFYVNFFNTPTETQIAWYILASEPNFPKNVEFYHFATVKPKNSTNQTETKLENLRCKKLTKTPLSDYYDLQIIKVKSQFEKETLGKLKFWIQERQDNFSILLLGERGTGKTKIVKSFEGYTEGKKIITANCAYFPDDGLAEAALFGTSKGSFTGVEEKKGLFFEANNNILFLDEIHHLSKRVQAKLLTALQTDSEGKYCYRVMGKTEDNSSKFQLLCASNRSIPELKKLLDEDFFDRISQRIIEIPNMRNSQTIEESFESVWKHMKFHKTEPSGKEKEELLKWLKTISFPGNYRTLEQITISVSDYIEAKARDKKLFVDKKDCVSYAKSEYEKRAGQETVPIHLKIVPGLTHNGYVKEFKSQLAQLFYEKYNTHEEAAKQLGLSLSSYYNWKGKK